MSSTHLDKNLAEVQAEDAVFEAWVKDSISPEKIPLDRHPNGAYSDTRSYLIRYGFRHGYRIGKEEYESVLRFAYDGLNDIASRLGLRPSVEVATTVSQIVDALPTASLQSRVQPWMMECFGPEISADKRERNHRFLEEAVELVQSTGCMQEEAQMILDYVYGRPVGEIGQEVGGVMITLAALCLANEADMHAEGDKELQRIWGLINKIREKQATKPRDPTVWGEVNRQVTADLAPAMALLTDTPKKKLCQLCGVAEDEPCPKVVCNCFYLSDN